MNTSAKKTIAAAIDEVVALARRVVPPKMTAAVLYGSEDLRIEEIDVPSLAADEALLRVRLALTDGTDLKVWKRGYHAKMIRPPAIFGHEVVGEVVAVGKRVDARWRLGVRVVAANSAPCFRCYHCRRGQENLCEDLLCNNGAYAEYMRIPGRIVTENMLEVPHSVDDQSAALVEPLACVPAPTSKSNPPLFTTRKLKLFRLSTTRRASFAKLLKRFAAATSPRRT